ncbi:LIC_10190 family membrane protein [Butyrivibrio proteoclasticus]|uniref:LIC_10190 family membrane protein n=1 Tax=Butyrivibrio proteoclasticus TaxID=43305 RepID=UPI00047A16BE|nr:hypothetical protein [Butyrivibrio proteoclasticus]
MLIVSLIWIYVIITTYLIGYGFLTSMSYWPGMHIRKGKDCKKKYKTQNKKSYIVAGLVLTTVYAQIFSLFTGVGLYANFLMVLICLIIAVYYREELLCDFRTTVSMLASTKEWIVYLLVFLVMAYGTSHGIMHYDSDLYHAQAIRWIEEYGVVKGLGNLHVRLAYNSSSFALSALYSLKFLGKQSYHVMAGFFALMLAWLCVDIKDVVRRKHIIVSDFARITAIYYLFTIFDEMVAPASDYYLSTIVFYVIIQWLDLNVKHEKSYLPYIQLSLLAIYAITIKLSAAPMILLCIIPIYKLFHERTAEKMRAFGLSIVSALIIVLPFLIRNIVISGWILYPVTMFDFFGFGFEIPKNVAKYDALEISTYGKGFTDVEELANISLKEWINTWFNGLGTMHKAVIGLDIISIAIFVACLIYFIIVAIGENDKTSIKLPDKKVFDISHRSVLNLADFLTISATLLGCLVFWFFSAPLIRYGVVYVYLTPAVIIGRMLIHLFNHSGEGLKKIVLKVCVVLFCLWMLYKGFNIVMEDRVRFNAKYLVAQQDYGKYEVSSYTLNGVKFYYPVEGDRIGYDAFPSSPKDMTGEIELMGTNIRTGFRSLQED